MNEKIKQLALQAKQYAEDEQNNPLKIYTLDCFNEKFAELIVKDLLESMLDYYGPKDCLPMEEIQAFTKEHFGVEE